MIYALIVFALMYVLMMLFPQRRTYFCLFSALVMLTLGILPLNKAFLAVNWNVLIMLFSTMGTVCMFTQSKMPARLADRLLQYFSNSKLAIVMLCVFSGFISAFMDNVATVIMVAPIGLSICRKLKTNPVPVILSIAVSSNLQGAATLVGDTTSILLGFYANMNFLDFFVLNGKPSVFWVVELGALATTLVLLFLIRNENSPVSISEITMVTDYFPSFMMLGTILCLVLVSFFTLPFLDSYKNGLVCFIFFLICMARSMLRPMSRQLFKNLRNLKLHLYC